MEVTFKWQVEPGLAIEELTQRYSQAIFQAGNRVVDENAKDMEEWTKEHAPWTDRTGDARRTLSAKAEDVGENIRQIVLRHGVPYGVWLEIANQGRFAIITPTLDYWTPVFLRNLQIAVNQQRIVAR